MHLQLGIVELDVSQIYVIKHRNENLLFRLNSNVNKPISDYNGVLTQYGRKFFLECISDMIQEKFILQRQLDKAKTSTMIPIAI